MCIIKVYLPPRSISEWVIELQNRIGQVVVNVEQIGVKNVKEIIWHFPKDSMPFGSQTGITIEICSFIGILYQAKLIRQVSCDFYTGR